MKNARFTLLVASLVSLFVVAWSVAPAPAQFRRYTPIFSAETHAGNMPSGAQAVERFEAITRSAIEPELTIILDKWNSPQMAKTLADSFFDRTRLLDAVNTEVPRDARLRLLSLQTVRTLEQYQIPGTAARGPQRVSIVSAIARTQLEFTSATGFVQLPGTNEFILEITRPVALK